MKLLYLAKWNEAIIWGFPAGIIGFLIGNDTRILFGLFCWGFVTGTIIGVKVVFLLLSGAVTSKDLGNGGRGSSLIRKIWGGVIGAGAGAVLGQILVGTVQFGALLGGAILGVIVAMIVGVFTRRRANN